ncbi:MAG: lysophospholipid acyltransferase family protein, partial [Polyangiaceae bacterium]
SGASVIRIIQDLLEKGDTVCVFPEGTTFADDVVRPFQAGAFVAASRANAEIVPVGIVYEAGSGAAFVGEPFMAHLARLAGASPSRVRISIGEALRASSHDGKELAQKARDAVQDLVDAARVGF